jgi:hypothetical protein
MEQSIHTVAELSIGPAQRARNLTWFPLSGNQASPLDYLMVDAALEAKKVVLEEVGEGGSVPELRLVNFTGKHVLVPDGTELVGAKQNRVVNASLLIAPDTSTTIPVSCVEQGRWEYRTRQFGGSRHHAAHAVRRGIADAQKAGLKTQRGYASDQHRVWKEVTYYQSKMGVSSPTSSMNDVYEQREATLKDYSGKIALRGGETGGAFFAGKRFLALDLFDRPSTYAALFGKLLSSMSIEAIPGGKPTGEEEGVAVPEERLAGSLRKVLGEVSAALFEVHRPVGVGEDWRYEAKHTFGKALHFDGALLHLSSFAQ